MTRGEMLRIRNGRAESSCLRERNEGGTGYGWKQSDTSGIFHVVEGPSRQCQECTGTVIKRTSQEF